MAPATSKKKTAKRATKKKPVAKKKAASKKSVTRKRTATKTKAAKSGPKSAVRGTKTKKTGTKRASTKKKPATSGQSQQGDLLGGASDSAAGSASIDDISYNADVMAELFRMTPRRIQAMAEEGIIPKSGRGRYPLVASVQGYIAFLKERARTGAHKADEAIRLKSAQADLQELKLAEIRGDLIPTDYVQQILFKAATIMRNTFDGAAARIATELSGGPEMHGELTRTFDDILQQFGTGIREIGDGVARDGLDVDANEAALDQEMD
ncbi:MAG: hypothetical protein AAFR07_05650 [Pseudomonadota bacterium]